MFLERMAVQMVLRKDHLYSFFFVQCNKILWYSDLYIEKRAQLLKNEVRHGQLFTTG